MKPAVAPIPSCFLLYPILSWLSRALGLENLVPNLVVFLLPLTWCTWTRWPPYPVHYRLEGGEGGSPGGGGRPPGAPARGRQAPPPTTRPARRARSCCERRATLLETVNMTRRILIVKKTRMIVMRTNCFCPHCFSLHCSAPHRLSPLLPAPLWALP